MSLGDLIRITRQKAFYTQKGFAQKLNIALSTVNRWEQDKVLPNVKAMKSIKAFCEENVLPYSKIEEQCETKLPGISLFRLLQEPLGQYLVLRLLHILD